MKSYSIFTIVLFSFLLMTSFINCQPKANAQEELNKKPEKSEKELLLEGLRLKADSALMYARSKGLDTTHCVLIDFRIHSGKNRMFVWDFANDTIKHAGLCCHGYGNEVNRGTPQTPKFSNEPGSLCSSLGLYKIGVRGYSNWGTNVSYKLHGLDKTNSNAYKRIVTLHSHTPVPEKEIYPQHLPLGYSQGCTVIADYFMREMDDFLKVMPKPVLMWIYY